MMSARGEIDALRKALAKAERERDEAIREREKCSLAHCNTLNQLEDAGAKIVRLREALAKAERERDEERGVATSRANAALLRGRAAHDAQQALRAAQARIARLLRSDQPWSLRETLARLADAVDHGLDAHCCDHMGHEGDRYAVTAAREIVALLNTPDAGDGAKGVRDG